MKKFLVVIVLALLIPIRVSAHPSEPVEYEGCEEWYTSEDVLLLANCIYFENWYNSMKVRALTGSVVINRVNSKYFPNTIQGVLSQRGQYSTWMMFGTACLPKGALHQAEMLLRNGSVAPEDVLFQAMFKQGREVYYTENGEYFCRY